MGENAGLTLSKREVVFSNELDPGSVLGCDQSYEDISISTLSMPGLSCWCHWNDFYFYVLSSDSHLTCCFMCPDPTKVSDWQFGEYLNLMRAKPSQASNITSLPPPRIKFHYFSLLISLFLS